MSVNDRFEQAGERLKDRLSEVQIPLTPEVGWLWWRFVAVMAVGVVLAVGGSLLWIARSDEPGHDLVAGSAVTVSTTTSTGSTVATNASTVAPEAVVAVSLLPSCEAATQRPTAAADMYRDDPVYEDTEATELAAAAQGYASTLPGYSTVWVDQEHNNWVAVGFVDTDLAERQHDLDEEFPGEGVVALELDYTISDLEAFGNNLAAVLPAGMTVHRTHIIAGYVGVWVGVASPERIEELAAVVDDQPVCWEGHPADRVVSTGGQAASGEGWRYLAEFDRGIGQRSQLVTSEADLDALWSTLGTREPLPIVDLASEIVFAFEVGYNDSCPETRFDGIEVTGDVVDLVVVDPTIGTGPPRGCNYNHMPRIYVVAISRDQLPTPPFTIEAGDDGGIYATIETSL